MLRNIFNYTLIASTIRLSTPLILAALGGLYSERSGVINIALEGMMLAGAFTAAAVTVFTHSSLVGVLAAVAAGVLPGRPGGRGRGLRHGRRDRAGRGVPERPLPRPRAGAGR